MDSLLKILGQKEALVKALLGNISKTNTLDNSVKYIYGEIEQLWLKEILEKEIEESKDENHKIDKWSQKVVENYSEPARAYHTLTHVFSMLWFYIQNFPKTGLEHNSKFDYAAINFCIFHDIIYDPKATGGSNEIKSLELYEEFVNDLELDKDIEFKETHEFVIESIRDTIKHCKHPWEGDWGILNGFLLDWDLSILSSKFESSEDLQTTNTYMSYAKNIRQEYIHVEYDKYWEVRAKVMQNFLAKDSIYFTEEVKEHSEESARKNIQREIKILEDKKI